MPVPSSDLRPRIPGGSRARRRQGIAIILTVIMLVVIIPMVGLVVEGAMLYAIRARLQLAADASALGSARSLSVGQTLAEQEAAARLRATRYFDANFPDGFLSTTNKTLAVSVTESAYRTRTVAINTSVQAPSYFMRMLGWGSRIASPTVSVTSEASRRDVNVMMVIDRSGSLDTAGACDDLENASIGFVDLFANGRDRLGLITYGGSFRLDYAPTMNFKNSPTLASELAKLHPNGCNGWTGSAQALWKGYEQLVAINEPGSLNVILFFTDGQPNTITAEFNVKTLTTPEVSYTSHCFDWGNNKYYYQTGWNPVNQRYLGFIAGSVSSGRGGVRGHQAGPMPVSADPSGVAIPVGFSGSPKSADYDCYYRSDQSKVTRDIAYYPNTDYYGNSVFGYKPVSVYPAGHPYAGKVKITELSTQQNAAVNALDNAAQRIRARELNSGISVVIYSIGLGGVGEAEHTLLQRVANVRESPIYDANSPAGLYIYAPNAAQLNDAFVRIASEVLRYSR